MKLSELKQIIMECISEVLEEGPARDYRKKTRTRITSVDKESYPLSARLKGMKDRKADLKKYAWNNYEDLPDDPKYDRTDPPARSHNVTAVGGTLQQNANRQHKLFNKDRDTVSSKNKGSFKRLGKGTK